MPSLQVAPFDLAGFEQRPVDGLQVPASWHWSDGVQLTVLVPLQTPDWQVSVRVQALPSLHGAVLFVWTHPLAGSHESFVQTLLSLQFSGGPPWH